MSQPPIAHTVQTATRPRFYGPQHGAALPGAVAVFDAFGLSCDECGTEIADTPAALALAGADSPAGRRKAAARRREVGRLIRRVRR